jgi:hypothetical protein
MGSRQNAVKAFLDVVSCDDSTMLDRWIPDEDWVRQIRENGERDCSIANLNRGMSAQCCWQNNHVTLQGETIFYNKKNIQTTKSKVIASKPIRFYYVLSAGKPPPSVPSGQGFYQSLWDHPDRSNRSLKRTAPPAPVTNKKEESPPPTKKAKASSPTPRPVTPENVPTLPPISFCDASRMVQEAWKVAFPSLRFPVKLIGLFPPQQEPAPAPASKQQTNKYSSKCKVRDIQVGNGVVIHDVPTKYELVLDSDLARFRRERGLVAALKDVLDQKTNQPSQHTKHLLAAFAASHPQISVVYQELLIALARFTFLLEVKGKMKEAMDVSFMNLTNVANCSPCCTSLTNWVTELAKDQYLIFSRKMDDANVFCQSDGGQKGQEVRLFTILDKADTSQSEYGSICEFWADLTYTGKTSDEVAAGTNHSLKKFGHPNKRINGGTSDSGAGTPESYANACDKIGIWHPEGMSDSCGLHDLQSVFRLAMQQFVGEGGLDARNALQLLHTVFSLYLVLKSRWKRVVKLVWAKTNATQEEMPDDLLNSIDAPKDLLKAMQEPLVTRWWTIGSLAILTTKHLDFFLLLAKGVCNMTNTDQKENIIASNLLSLASSEWIVADVYFIAGISQSWLNPHMKWYQGSDPNIGRPGFLCFHRAVRYFLMIDDIDVIRDDWRTNEVFSKFSRQVQSMSNPKLKSLKEGMVDAFVRKMRSQVQKHNKRYVLTRSIVRSVFADWQTGQAVAQLLKGGEPSLSVPFFSELHDREINCEKFYKFIQDEVPLTVLEQLRTDPAVTLQQEAIDEIAVSGLDIWSTTNRHANAHLF